jgi:hypothetical protein
MITFPALETTAPAATVSADYKFLSSAAAMAEITARTGWAPVKIIGQSRGNKTHGKHVILFRHPAYPGDGVAVPQIALVNSHDGRSAWRLLAAFHVSVCSNGLFAASGTVGDFRVRHIGNAAEAVIECIDKLTARVNLLLETKARMESTRVTADGPIEFARFGASLRGISAFNLNSLSMLKIEHNTQALPTVWNVFNRVQARVIRGGFEYVAQKSTPDGRLVSVLKRARKLSGVTATVNANEKLWRYAEGLIAA